MGEELEIYVRMNLNDANYWLGRSEEARSIAGVMPNPDASAAMLTISRNYKVIADLVRSGVFDVPGDIDSSDQRRA